jgi:hypothetical protein
MAVQEIIYCNEPQKKTNESYDYLIILRSALEVYSIPKRTIITNFLFVVADRKFGITCCVDSVHRERHI